MNTKTNFTSAATDTTGFPPVPPEAHQQQVWDAEFTRNLAQMVRLKTSYAQMGKAYMEFVDAGEISTARVLRKDLCRAMACADALCDLLPTLTKEQAQIVELAMVAALHANGL